MATRIGDERRGDRRQPAHISLHSFAAGALLRIHEPSLRVPDGVSVADIFDTYAPSFVPPLTTVEQPVVGTAGPPVSPSGSLVGAASPSVSASRGCPRAWSSVSRPILRQARVRKCSPPSPAAAWRPSSMTGCPPKKVAVPVTSNLRFPPRRSKAAIGTWGPRRPGSLLADEERRCEHQARRSPSADSECRAGPMDRWLQRTGGEPCRLRVSVV